MNLQGRMEWEMKKYQYLKLKHLIIGVALAAFFITLVSSLWSGYRVNVSTIKENTLETNRVYAQKLAETANTYLEESFQILGYSAKTLAEKMDDEQVLTTETERIKMQYNMFNSVIVTNADGLVLSISPPSIEVQGEVLTSEGATEALAQQVPLVSKPYKGITGRLLIFISYPIFNEAGQYVGQIGGTIYLKEDNVFYKLLGQHYYGDGSNVFVVDEDGSVIYHENPARINDDVVENEVVQKVVAGKSGAQQVVNTEGVEMLAGYSPIPLANWGVVSQRSLEVALSPSMDYVKNMAFVAMPLLVFCVVLVLWAAARIARPLQQLATFMEESLDTKNVKSLESVSGWYYEASSLKGALVRSLSFLQGQVSFFRDQSITDPLTGVTNRRTMDALLAEWIEKQVPHAIILLDLDHFKSVNDTYGHAVGDKVLKFLAENMQAVAREQDVCCRFGGEEFILLLPQTTVTEAEKIAEQLRGKLANTVSPSGRVVTLSAGVAEYPGMATTTEALFEAADVALYHAKQTGRNCVVVAGQEHMQEV